MKKSEIYKDSNRSYYEKNKDKIKKYNHDRYYSNLEKERANHKEYYNKNKSKIHRRGYERYHEYRSNFIEMYGGRCECCEESIYEFLTIEHIGGQVGKRRESSHTAYRSAVLNYDKNKYKILCSNCNQATRFGSICPHKRREIMLKV